MFLCVPAFFHTPRTEYEPPVGSMRYTIVIHATPGSLLESASVPSLAPQPWPAVPVRQAPTSTDSAVSVVAVEPHKRDPTVSSTSAGGVPSTGLVVLTPKKLTPIACRPPTVPV